MDIPSSASPTAVPYLVNLRVDRYYQLHDVRTSESRERPGGYAAGRGTPEKHASER